MYYRLFRILGISGLAIVPFAFGVAHADVDSSTPAGIIPENTIAVEMSADQTSDVEALNSPVVNDMTANTQTDGTAAGTEAEQSVVQTVNLKLESVNGILRITDDNGNFYKGFHKIGDKVYYADANAAVISNRLFIDNGKSYISGTDASIQTGVVLYRGAYYYCDLNDNGAVRKQAGFIEWNGNRYYVNTGGKLFADGYKVIGDRGYIASADAKIQMGVAYNKDNGYYYYCNPEEGGAICFYPEFVEWNGNRYYINAGAKIFADGYKVINGRGYIASKDGKIQMGVAYNKDNGYYYYCNPEEGGAICYNPEFKEWNGNRYYINAGAKIFADGYKVINGRGYIASKDGKIQMGVVYNKENGYYYYCNPEEGGAICFYPEFKEWNGNRYYINAGGKIFADGYKVIDGRGYIASKDGKIQMGVAYNKANGNYYYCNPKEGGAISYYPELIEWNGNKYYITAGAPLAKNVCVEVNGKTYYAGKDCKFMTGVVYSMDRDCCYFCDPADGGAIRTVEGDITWNGKVYHIGKNGRIIADIEIKLNAMLDSIGRTPYNVYKYLAKQKYYRMYVDPKNGKEWFATYGYNNGVGNCYVKTAMMYYMMKAMGYDNIRAIDGFCMGYRGEKLPHGWIEYYENGKTYIIDPTFENEVGRNGYMIEYGQKGTWKYMPEESRIWIE